MADTAARMLALLGLLQSRSDWSGRRARRTGSASPTGPSATTSTGCAASATRSTPSAGRAVATGSGSAPSCRRCCSRTTRRSPSPSGCAPAPAVAGHRGDQRPGAGQARARAPPPAPAPGQRAARRRERRPGEHRVERRRPGGRPGAAGRGGGAVRDHVELRFDYQGERLQLEPYRLVSWQRRWFVVGRDARTGTLGAVPAGLDAPAHARRPPVHPAAAAGEDYTSFVLREVAFSGWIVHARIAVDAPAEDVLARINPTVGVVESVDADHCVLVTGGDSVEIDRGLHRHARPRLPRHRAARTGRGRGAGRRSLPAGRHSDFWNSTPGP